MSVYCEFCGNPTEWLTTRQVSRVLGVSLKTVRKYIDQGRFPGTVRIPGIVQGSTIFKIPASAVVPLVTGRNGEEP